MSDLATRHCAACHGGSALPEGTLKEMLTELKAWELLDGRLVKTFAFKNYYETMAFVNALAWVSHKEDHHPDLVVSYNKCRVEYWANPMSASCWTAWRVARSTTLPVAIWSKCRPPVPARR
jgi:4a-hydroxytetrahydrobiopterin dehydratase